MDMVTDTDLLQRLGLALTIGLLVGVERGWHSRGDHAGLRVAGIRTFTLIALLGGVWGMLGDILGDVVLGIAFLGFAALTITAYILSLREKSDFGLTTEVAALLTFALGVVAVRGDMVIASAGTVVMVALLDMKRRLHAWVARIEKLEIDAAIKLLLISVVLLPVLPNEGFGPGGVLNPFELWWMVVLISGLSFSGYIAVRLAGPHLGVIMTALFAGLVSSTAVAVSLSRLGKQSPSLHGILAGGVVLASSIMFVRIIIVTSILNADLIPVIALPMGVMAGVCALCGLGLVIFGRKADGKPAPDLKFDDPAEIITAIKFGLFLGLVVLLAHFMKQWFGDEGLYALSAASGLADVDAITISMARMARDTLPLSSAASAIVVAAFANTVVKAVIVVLGCPEGMGWRVGGVFGLAMLVGAVTLFI